MVNLWAELRRGFDAEAAASAVAFRAARRQAEHVWMEVVAVPGQEQVLRDAYRHFANWPNERQLFEALLDPNVEWVETDRDLGPGNYRGRAEVMAHLDHIAEHVDSASLVSVNQEPQGWQTRDDMQVHGHDLHCCITDIDFSGDLISRVVHCRGHVEIGRGPCG